MMVATKGAAALLLLMLAGSHSAAASRALQQKSTTTDAALPGSAQDRVMSFRQLPVGPKLDSQFYSGYITMNAAKGHKMFYVAGEAETNPAEAPMIFWMNGGPGCSSVGLGFVKGCGPFIPTSNGSLLLSNSNSFTKFANVLWLEQPQFTGFSISNDESERVSDDTKTAQGMLHFLLAWYERFPQFKANKLFLAGQSYAGHYGPLLAKAILDYNEATRKANAQDGIKQAMLINLSGLAMGNAWTDPTHDNAATVDFYYDNGLISRDVYDGLNKCDLSTGAMWRTDGPSGFSPECEKLRDQALKQIGDIDLYGLNAPICVAEGRNAVYPARDYNFFGWAVVDPCAAKVLTKVMNDRDVQIALGAIEPSEETKMWKGCNGKGISYSLSDMATSMVPVYKDLVSRGLPVLYTSGEADGFVPLAGSRAWIESMQLPLRDPAVPIRQWRDTHTEQIGGTVVEYEGLTRVSVRFAGHSLSSWRPFANTQIIKTFVNGGQLPSYESPNKGPKITALEF